MDNGCIHHVDIDGGHVRGEAVGIASDRLSDYRTRYMWEGSSCVGCIEKTTASSGKGSVKEDGNKHLEASTDVQLSPFQVEQG